MTTNRNAKTVYSNQPRQRVGRPDKRDRRNAINRKQGFLSEAVSGLCVALCLGLSPLSVSDSHADETGTWYAVPVENGLMTTMGPMDEHLCYDRAIALLETHGFRFACFEACSFEDSNNCVWDATQQGNRVGQSYYADTLGRVFNVTIKPYK